MLKIQQKIFDSYFDSFGTKRTSLHKNISWYNVLRVSCVHERENIGEYAYEW